MTVRELQNDIAKRLGESGVLCPENEAEQILLNASGWDRLHLFTSQRSAAPDELAAGCEKIVSERLTGRPLQYILGKAYFMGLEFFVDENVLIPRQDTELTAETAIGFLDERKGNAKVLDLCTGSGALAVSIKSRFENADVTASDISPKALEIAKKNAFDNDCYVTFVLSDLFEKIGGQFDLIVSNPPYIETDVIKTLQREVRDHEPVLALDGGADGLDLVRKIIADAPARLAAGGMLLIEIGEGQGALVLALAEKQKDLTACKIVKDLNGLDRMLYCRKA